MTWVLLFLLCVAIAFGFVVLFGPPYLPTLQRNKETALDLLNLKAGQTMLELGCGDGRVLAAAAKRGISAVGIELNPLLVAVSWLRTRRYRTQVRIIWGSYFSVQWPPAEGIFTFMLPRQMAKLDQEIERWHKKPVRLASFGFAIPNKKPVAVKDGVFLYHYR
jgi:SAM-dependent methyltransferase